VARVNPAKALVEKTLDTAHRIGLLFREPPPPPSGVFTYDPPVSPETIAGWQARLDEAFYKGENAYRILIRWSAGDPWQPIGRFFLWLAVDPRASGRTMGRVTIEPWIREQLNAMPGRGELPGPSPRSKGHYCGEGYCQCRRHRNRWVTPAIAWLDTDGYRIWRDTGLYATRWWVLQGEHGGHRFMWDHEEIASVVASMKTGQAQPPLVGALPYTDFDERVIRAVRRERVAGAHVAAMEAMWKRKQKLQADEQDTLLATNKLLWDWAGEEAEKLWADGGDALPGYFEDQYGRAPVGHQLSHEFEKSDEEHLHHMSR
jgi:hypothetical protein